MSRATWTIEKFQFRPYTEKFKTSVCVFVYWCVFWEKCKESIKTLALFSKSSFQLLKTQKKGFRSEVDAQREGDGLQICSHPIFAFIVSSYEQTHWAIFLKARHSGSFQRTLLTLFFTQASTTALWNAKLCLSMRIESVAFDVAVSHKHLALYNSGWLHVSANAAASREHLPHGDRAAEV